MKKLKILIAGLFVFLNTQSFGQGWEYAYPAPVDTLPTKFITADKMLNGDIIIHNESYSQVLAINSAGLENWFPIQSLSNLVTFGTEHFSKDNIIAASDGNFFLVDDNYTIGGGVTLNSKGLQIAKLNSNFDTIWTKSYSQIFPDDFFIVTDVKQLSDSNLIVLAFGRNTINEIEIIKIDHNNGNILWTQSLTVNGSERYFSKEIIENSDNTLMLFYQMIDVTNSYSDFRLSKLSSTGGIIWTQTYLKPDHTGEYTSRTLDHTPDGGYVFSLATKVSNTTPTVVVKTDSVGNELWRTPIGVREDGSVTDLLVTSDSSILVVGGDMSLSTNSYFITKLDMNGVIQFNKKYSNTNYHWNYINLQKVIELSANHYVAIGTKKIHPAPPKILAIRFDGNGNTFRSTIEGNVYMDQNQNCSLDTSENVLTGTTVLQIVQNTDTTYAATDLNGFYSIGVIPGLNYEIIPISESNYWVSCSYPIITLNTNDSITQNLGLQPLIACTDLMVNITTPVLTRCFSNTYYVDYSNIGTQNEANVYIEVELDPFFIVNSASIPYTQNGDIYTFQVGSLSINQSGQFTIDVTVDCTAQLGQPHCVSATIYPFQICLPNGNNWSGATIIADAFCDSNDSVTFRLENIGTGDMTQPRSYYVAEDQILPYQGTYDLDVGEDTLITIPANGYTYQIAAEQEITHPWGNITTSAVTFGCNNTGSVNVNNLINQFNLGDYLNFVDVDCQVNVGSYDPNDKQGFPIGYGTNHIIEKSVEIEYMLRFQNTGTAPAVNVEIKDPIDVAYLDISTLQLQSSSHPYVLSIEDGNTLVFKFDNIMLPDSNTNEPASYGFVRFKIGQQANNPLGTVIENSAAIYFDFNAPIITNTTFHTIGENFIQLVSTKSIKEKVVDVKVFPNPFMTQTTVEISSEKQFQNLTLTIFDVMGRAIKTVQSNENNRITLDRDGLTTGIYFYQIQSNGLVLDMGKLMAQ